MKKIFSLLISLVMLLAVLPSAQASEYMNVYAPDGRSERIRTSDFYAWHAVGWYSSPVMYVYALDGRCELILNSDYDAWHKVGWYSVPMMYVYSADGRTELIPKDDYYAWNAVGWYSDTPIIIYAPDGRSRYIPKNEFSQWQKAGWYSAPVMYVYAPDGRVQLILNSELAKWQKAGWYTKPVITIYAGNKSKVVPKEDVMEWKKVGWDAYVPLTLPNGNTISVLTNNVGNYVNTDPAIYYNPKVYRPLSEIQYSPYGTNITLERAKEIAKSYVDKNVVYGEDGLASYMNQWYGGVSNYENQIPELEDYSDSAYLIALHVCDIVIGVSVNKTTGYAFRCGEGAMDGWSIGLVY